MLKNCRRCARVYAHSVYDTCPLCREQEEQEYTVVHEYVVEFPGSSAPQVSKATGVEIQRILHFLQQGRFNAQAMGVALRCEVCEVPVTSGRICDGCRARLQNNTENQGGQPRMHIAETERHQKRRKN